MAYCTIDDVKKMIDEVKLIRLTDDAGTGVIDEAKTSEAITSAAEEIDTYIGGRVKLPIAGTPPPMFGKINVDIAIYNLYSRARFLSRLLQLSFLFPLNFSCEDESLWLRYEQ